jgi:hypothetical protein
MLPRVAAAIAAHVTMMATGTSSRTWERGIGNVGNVISGLFAWLSIVVSLFIWKDTDTGQT